MKKERVTGAATDRIEETRFPAGSALRVKRFPSYRRPRAPPLLYAARRRR